MGWGRAGRQQPPPPSRLPWVPPRSYCLFCLHLFKSKTSTHARAHAHTRTPTRFCTPRKPLLLSSETCGLPPRAPLTQDLPLSGPRGLVMAREAEHGEGKRRALGLPPPTTLGRPVSLSLSFLSCKMGSPQRPRLPQPPGAGTDEGNRKALLETWKHWEVVAGGVLRTRGPLQVPRGCSGGAEAEECSRLVAQGLGRGSSQAPPGWPLPVPGLVSGESH